MPRMLRLQLIMTNFKSPQAIAAAVCLAALGAAGYAWKQGYLGAASSPTASTQANASASGQAIPANPSSAARGPQGSQGPGGPGGPVAVEVATVQGSTLRDEAAAVGSLRSRQAVMVKPEVAGRIAALGFAEGQAVQRGQLLVQLDDSLQRAELEQAKAQGSIAQSNYNRNRDLVAQNFVAQRVLDESAANLQVAQAQVKLAEARLGRMRITAPFAGTTGLKNVSVGDYVKDGAEMVNIEDLSLVFADFRLPERYLSRVRKGQLAEVLVDALNGRKFNGRIVAIDPLLDAAGRAVSIRAQIDNSQRELRPGMFVRVNLQLGQADTAVMIPEEALVPVVGKVGKQAVIKVVNGKSQRVEVKPGTRRDGKVQILEGVGVGDVVVTAGQQRLQKDETAVKVVELGKPAAAPTAPPSAPPSAAASAQKGS
jgi:membrane fusion protein, multidrug efflux system